MSDLLPCPFCGGEPEMDTLRSYRNITTGRLGDGVSIYCTGCSADMMMCRADHPGMETEEIIYVMRDAWNRRTPASPSPSDAREEALRKAFDLLTDNKIDVAEAASEAAEILASALLT